jgi:hypothetical protein
VVLSPEGTTSVLKLPECGAIQQQDNGNDHGEPQKHAAQTSSEMSAFHPFQRLAQRQLL